MSLIQTTIKGEKVRVKFWIMDWRDEESAPKKWQKELPKFGVASLPVNAPRNQTFASGKLEYYGESWATALTKLKKLLGYGGWELPKKFNRHIREYCKQTGF